MKIVHTFIIPITCQIDLDTRAGDGMKEQGSTYP